MKRQAKIVIALLAVVVVAIIGALTVSGWGTGQTSQGTAPAGIVAKDSGADAAVALVAQIAENPSPDTTASDQPAPPAGDSDATSLALATQQTESAGTAATASPTPTPSPTDQPTLLVLNPDGTPAAGASYFVPSIGGSSARGLTDAQGTVLFPNDLPSDALVAAESRQGQGTAVAGTERPVVIRIEPWAALDVELYDTDGLPHPRMDIALTFERSHLQLPSNMATRRAAFCDDNGRVAFESLPANHYKVVPGFSKPAENLGLWKGDTDVWLEPGERKTIRLRRMEGDRLEGIVVTRDQRPLPAVNIRAFIANLTDRSAVTDTAGLFAVDDIPPGLRVVHVWATKTGYAAEYRGNLSGHTGELRIVMDPLAGVQFRVFEAATQAPIAEGTLELKAIMGDENWRFVANRQSAELKPDAGGLLELRDIRPGRYRVRFTETSNGRPTGRAGMTDFHFDSNNPPTDPIPVPVSGGLVVEGMVTWADSDEPVPNAAVLLRSEDERVPPQDTRTSEGGAFLFAGVAPGSYAVEVSSEEAQGDLAHPVAVGSDAPPPALDLRLHRGGLVRLTALVPPAQRNTPVTVVFKLSGTNTRVSETVHGDGVDHREVRLTPGNWEALAINGEENDPREERLAIAPGGEYELAFNWNDEPLMHGTIAINGNPWNGNPALLLNAQGRVNAVPLPLENPAPGRFRVRGPAGTYAVTVANQSGTGIDTDQLLELGPDAPRDRHLDLDLLDVDLVVVDKDGKEPTDLHDAQGMEFGFNIQLPSGRTAECWIWYVQGSRARVAWLPPGTYEVALNIEGRTQGRSEPTPIGPGEKNIIMIELDKKQRRVFELTLTLPPGTHTYKFFAPPADWFPDPSNPWQTQDGYHINSAVRVPGGALTPEGARAMWPRVDDATGRVTFRAELDIAGEDLYIRGSFNDWQQHDTFRLTPLE